MKERLLLGVQVTTFALLIYIGFDMLIARWSEPSELERRFQREALIDRLKNQYKACRARNEEALFVLGDEIICVKK